MGEHSDDGADDRRLCCPLGRVNMAFTTPMKRCAIPDSWRLYALEWGELVLIFGGTPEISAVGRSRK